LKRKQLKELQPAWVTPQQKEFLGHMKESDQFEVEYMLRVNPQLVSCHDEKGNTPLHYASRTGDLDMVKMLLSKNANPNIKNKVNM
jgi:ankyrin repeat protein